jgi:hypothetical protein
VVRRRWRQGIFFFLLQDWNRALLVGHHVNDDEFTG